MNELALLAGGDESELAVQEIRQNVITARERLRRSHPFFYEPNQEIPCTSP